ncbi:hypothetical protein [Streptomyces sp. NPDC055607]
MSGTDQTDGTTIVAAYFEDRIAEAQKEVEEARAALAAAEAKVEQRQSERDTFVRDGSLPPAAYNSATGQPEWELCQWAQSRIGEIAFKDMTRAGDAVYAERKAQEAAAHAWLEENGYGVPSVFRREQ